MFTIHCTAKLVATLKITPGALTPSTTRLGNWYATRIGGARGPFLCVSERTFLPVVIERCPAAQLPHALAEALAALLSLLGIPRALIEQESSAMTQVSWAKTVNRSAIGVLTEQGTMASLLLAEEMSLAALNRELADNIVKLSHPVDLTREAFGVQPPAEEHSPARAPNVDDLGQLVRDVASRLPVDAHVVGVPVQVLEVLREGNDERGLVAVCERGESRHRISLADVVFQDGRPEARLSALFRERLGLEPHQRSAQAGRHKASTLPLNEPIELVVLAAKSSALRCRLVGTTRELTLRTAVRDEVPGEIITVHATKQWTHGHHPYLSGEVISSRLDVARLELLPLALQPSGDWNPAEEYWGEEGERLPRWAKDIIKRGPRPAFELEQVLPGADPDDWDSDPIIESNDLKAAGRRAESQALLQGLLAQDLRCLDAHAHLGNSGFDHRPEQAVRHYRAGVAIGDQSLGADFAGVLPWGLLDNRPYLRCLHGVGLCVWRLGEIDAAANVFRRMLWLNPADNQGARFNLQDVEKGRRWQPEEP